MTGKEIITRVRFAWRAGRLDEMQRGHVYGALHNQATRYGVYDTEIRDQVQQVEDVLTNRPEAYKEARAKLQGHWDQKRKPGQGWGR